MACLSPVYSVEKKENASLIATLPMNSEDPYEPFNRTMFEFNMGFNHAIGKPVADAYGELPQPARTGIENVFSNLGMPVSIVNSFLQGKVEDGLSGIMRFAINSTFGLFGVLDIATPAGLSDQKEDLGQTLYHWGVWNETSYVVLPFVGSYTMRELVGSAGDSSYDPVYPTLIEVDETDRFKIYAADKFLDYVQVVGFIDELKNQPDPYVFARESYLQHRVNKLYDGHPPQVELDDFDFD